MDEYLPCLAERAVGLMRTVMHQRLFRLILSVVSALIDLHLFAQVSQHCEKGDFHSNKTWSKWPHKSYQQLPKLNN